MAMAIIDQANAQGIGMNSWSFGGGTALMLQINHRESHDIDLFIEDAQYLPYLNPETQDYDLALAPSDYETDGTRALKIVFDGVGEIVARADNARAVQFTVRAPRELAKYIAHKGSITVDGTSLTVNAVNGAEFELTIVPHTLAETIMVDYQAGRKVNLEVDLLARYLERLLLGDKAAEPKASGLTESFLAEHGYLKN